jgi:anaerobic dimethyl sulfoxide reductase subunit B (iron-sulfur subunit)
MRFAFVFDQEKCMSCNVCTVACKDWNQINPGPVRWRTQLTYEESDGFFPLSMACNHCEDPACVKSCAYNAIIKRNDDGVVYIDRTLCRELRACITACPFAAPKYADDHQEPSRYEGWQVQHPAQKCDMCKDRLDKGQKPECVVSCVNYALDFGDYDALIADYASRGITLTPLSVGEFPYAYKNNTTETGPSFLIHKRGPQEIVKSIHTR